MRIKAMWALEKDRSLVTSNLLGESPDTAWQIDVKRALDARSWKLRRLVRDAEAVWEGSAVTSIVVCVLLGIVSPLTTSQGL